MIREFIYTRKFDQEWRIFGLRVMQGTGGIRKLRWALPNKGKSSGIRILYLDYIVPKKICMFDLFPKYEKSDLSQSEKAALKQVVKQIGEELK